MAVTFSAEAVMAMLALIELTQVWAVRNLASEEHVEATLEKRLKHHRAKHHRDDSENA